MMTNCPYVATTGDEAEDDSLSVYVELFDILNDDIIELGPSQGNLQY